MKLHQPHTRKGFQKLCTLCLSSASTNSSVRSNFDFRLNSCYGLPALRPSYRSRGVWILLTRPVMWNNHLIKALSCWWCYYAVSLPFEVAGAAALFSRVFVVAFSAPDGSDCFLRLDLLVVILIRSSFCSTFSFVEPLDCCLLLDSESASGSKARELSRSWPLSFIWFR